MTIENRDSEVVNGFGDEWSRFDQSQLDPQESLTIFNKYFNVFPWDKINSSSIGFDLGCGSGRWAKIFAPKVGTLHCIDPSSALLVAKKNLNSFNNCIFHNESVDELSLIDNSMDFGYSLGVLHHVPDTYSGIVSCVKKLKQGAPFLIYLYYDFDNKSIAFKLLWKCSDILRRIISKFPYPLRYIVSQFIAYSIYLPFAKFSKICELIGVNVNNFPLSFYRNKSLYTMRTDALDRFGTRLEQRFSKNEILNMMVNAGLRDIQFNEEAPFWCAVGIKK